MANFGGFSWKRFFGITKMKRKISRTVGIPLTKSGRQRKFGAMLTKSIFGTKRRKKKKKLW